MGNVLDDSGEFAEISTQRFGGVPSH